MFVNDCCNSSLSVVFVACARTLSFEFRESCSGSVFHGQLQFQFQFDCGREACFCSNHRNAIRATINKISGTLSVTVHEIKQVKHAAQRSTITRIHGLSISLRPVRCAPVETFHSDKSAAVLLMCAPLLVAKHCTRS